MIDFISELEKIAVACVNEYEIKSVTNVFKEYGFKIGSITSKFGFIGYIKGMYVANLTSLGVEYKEEVMSYENFMKLYKSIRPSKVKIIKASIHSWYWTLIGDVVDVESISDLDYKVIGIMNSRLPKEDTVEINSDNLENEVDWEDVTSGTKVNFWYASGEVKGQVKGVFHQYLSSMNKVVVIFGNDLKVIDEKDVSLEV